MCVCVSQIDYQLISFINRIFYLSLSLFHLLLFFFFFFFFFFSSLSRLLTNRLLTRISNISYRLIHPSIWIRVQLNADSNRIIDL